jgi:hypothetical protein
MSHLSSHRWSENADGTPQTTQPTYEKVADGNSQTTQPTYEKVADASGKNGRLAAQPQLLNNNDSRKIIACVIDVICLLISVAIFTFAMLVYQANDKVVESYHRDLLNTARIVSYSHTTKYLPTDLLPRVRQPSHTSSL